MQDAHENVRTCHAQEELGHATGMLPAMTIHHALPVVVRIGF